MIPHCGLRAYTTRFRRLVFNKALLLIAADKLTLVASGEAEPRSDAVRIVTFVSGTKRWILVLMGVPLAHGGTVKVSYPWDTRVQQPRCLPRQYGRYVSSSGFATKNVR